MQNWKRFLYLLAVAVFGLAGVARAVMDYGAPTPSFISTLI